MEKWQLSLYWPNVIGVVRGHVQPSLALCVCVWTHKFVCWRALNNAQLFPPMTNSLHKGCSLSHCSKALTCHFSVTGTSLLTRRGVHKAIY